MPGAPWKVPYLDLKKEHSQLAPELLEAVTMVLSNGEFILRGDVSDFQSKVQSQLGLPPVIGLNSGTDALYLAMRALSLRPGDEVVTTAHTFVATLAAVIHAGGRPVLVDVGDDFNMDPDLIAEKLTPRTRALLPVHMNGRVCRMDKMMKIASERGLAVIEDAAQAIGARYQGRPAGGFGDFGCFSMHPMKILNAAGDAGFVCAKNPAHLEKLLLLRNHGQMTKEELAGFGWNSRLDNLQAAILNVKLPLLEARIRRRREIARFYQDALSRIGDVRLPPPSVEEGDHFDVFSSYVIRCSMRDALAEHLRQAGIEVFSHWKRPLHLQSALNLGSIRLPKTEQLSTEVISLPIFPEMTQDQQGYVVEHIARFYKGGACAA